MDVKTIIKYTDGYDDEYRSTGNIIDKVRQWQSIHDNGRYSAQNAEDDADT